MKKIYLLSILMAGAFTFHSCNNEPDFDGLDEASKITNVQTYATTYTGAIFSESNPARNTLPGWLDAKYYTADKGSKAMVTYQYTLAIPEYVQHISNAKAHTLAATDYQEAWGEDSSLNYFSPSKPAATYLPVILANTQTEAAAGAILAVNYNEAAEDGTQPLFSDDFESNTLDKWQNVATVGEKLWRNYTFSNNTFAETTAYNVGSTVENYLITAAPIAITSGLLLSFDATYRYPSGDAKLSLLVSTDLAGFTAADITAATWDDLSANFIADIDQTGALTAITPISLDSYSGKNIYIAFKYNGDTATGATTTARVDNVIVAAADQKPATYTGKTALYAYNGTAWATVSDVSILQPADYTALGVEYFTAATYQAYMPSYLAYTYPLLPIGTVKAIAFQLSESTFMAAEYEKTITHWEPTAGTTELTDEYEYDGSNWQYVRTVPKAALNETFDDREITDKETTMLEGWLNVATIGTDHWRDRKYSGNNYVEATAYGGTSDDKMEVWLITPALEIKNNYIFTFDMVSGHWTHEALEVYVSSSFSGNAEDVPVVYTENNNEDAIANSRKEVEGWTNISDSFDFPVKIGGYSKFATAGQASLEAYAGQTVYIALRYWGNNKTGLTSTVQLDNLYVGE